MPPSTGREFRSRRACPEPDALLAYDAGTLGALTREQVRAHLGRCDFCGAASQLLSKQPTAEVQAVEAPLPLHLRLFAETLLSAHNADRQRAA